MCTNMRACPNKMNFSQNQLQEYTNIKCILICNCVGKDGSTNIKVEFVIKKKCYDDRENLIHQLTQNDYRF